MFGAGLAIPEVATAKVRTSFLATSAMEAIFGAGLYKGISGIGAFTVTRAAPATTYAKNSAGVWQSFAANTPRVTDLGLLVEEQRIQYLGVTSAPANQTTGSLPTGNYALWLEGSGSVSVAAGTATISAGGSATAAAPYYFSVSVTGTVSITVTGSVTFFQLEGGVSPNITTSKIDNAGAAGTTVTRNNDVVQLTSTNFSSWYNAAAGTFFGEYVPQDNTGGSVTRRLLEVHDGTANNRILLGLKNAVNQGRLLASVAAVAQADLTSAASYTGGVPIRLAGAYAAADYQQATNGVAGSTQASGTVPTVTTLNVGSDNSGSSNANGFVRRIGFIASRQPGAVLLGLAS